MCVVGFLSSDFVLQDLNRIHLSLHAEFFLGRRFSIRFRSRFFICRHRCRSLLAFSVEFAPRWILFYRLKVFPSCCKRVAAFVLSCSEFWSVMLRLGRQFPRARRISGHSGFSRCRSVSHGNGALWIGFLAGFCPFVVFLCRFTPVRFGVTRRRGKPVRVPAAVFPLHLSPIPARSVFASFSRAELANLFCRCCFSFCCLLRSRVLARYFGFCPASAACGLV
jgi:hypothetical protein